MGRVEDAFSNLMEAKDKGMFFFKKYIAWTTSSILINLDDITESQSNDVLAACAQAIYNVRSPFNVDLFSTHNQASL